MTFDVRAAQLRIDEKLAAAVARKLGVDGSLVSVVEHRPIRKGHTMTDPVFRVPAELVSTAQALGLVTA